MAGALLYQLQAHTFYNQPLSTSVHCCFTAAHHSTTFETNMSDVIKAVGGLGTILVLLLVDDILPNWMISFH